MGGEGWRLGVGSVPYFFVVSNDARWGKPMGHGHWAMASRTPVLRPGLADWRCGSTPRYMPGQLTTPLVPRLLSSAQLRRPGLIVGSLIDQALHIYIHIDGKCTQNILGFTSPGISGIVGTHLPYYKRSCIAMHVEVALWGRQSFL